MIYEKFLIRQKIINLIRQFFNQNGFCEVETPLLVKSPDASPYIEVFETKINSHPEKPSAYLTPSPEFFMKKLLASGYKNIYQICKAFRDEWNDRSPLHNPEFTIIEWYRTNANYQHIMKDCENLANFIYQKLHRKKLHSKNILIYQGKEIDISPPWEKISIKELFLKYARVNLDEFLSIENARKIASLKGYKIEKNTTWEQIYHQIFLNEIEPNFASLDKPIFIYDYPTILAALSKKKKSDPRYAERFEFYIAGIEVGNAFSELTDWQEQERRLIDDVKERKKTKMKIFDYDHEFIEMLKAGMPETGGIAVGIDRLVMFFSNARNIDEVIFFPAKAIFP